MSPSVTPVKAPKKLITIDSQRIIVRTCLRSIPTARSIPISRVRSMIDSARVLITPKIAMITLSPSRA